MKKEGMKLEMPELKKEEAPVFIESEEKVEKEEVVEATTKEEISEEAREELKKEIKAELEQENKKKKPRRNLFGIIFNLILITIAVIFIFFMYFANQNFKTVQEGNEPDGYSNKKNYVQDIHNVTVYEYGVYKIVVDNNGETTTYMLKPIFFKDIN